MQNRIDYAILKRISKNNHLTKILRILFVALFFSTLFLSCHNAPANKEPMNSNARLQVLFFHSTIRCPTCNAIEDNTKKVLDEYFRTLMDNGTIYFSSFNIDKEENRDLVEKYQISYTNLLLIKADGTKTDYTYTAFEYAYSEPAKYSELLKAEIEKNIK